MPDLITSGRVSPCMQCAAKKFPQVESSHPGTIIGRFFSAAASNQEFS